MTSIRSRKMGSELDKEHTPEEGSSLLIFNGISDKIP